jgi:protein-tyrosine phosphatase
MSQEHLPSPDHEAVNAPLKIDFITLPQGGRIGMVHCPGRRGRDGRGRIWARDLVADIDAIRRNGASTLVSLIEREEFGHYGVEDLPFAAANAGLRWIHWPIGDMKTASGATAEAMAEGIPALLDDLVRGETVVIHCAAGLGRTGTLAAQLLVLAGQSPDTAIERIRRTRPGTIETEAQADAVHQFVASKA